MGGVVKGFQIACNLAGPLGDLTGRGDQPSRKVVLVSSAVHVKGTTSTGSLQQEEDAQGCSQVGQTGIVKIHITLWEISVKLDKRSPIVLR